jgi:phosphoadenylyl-sulfate reductase (thioredoxin)
MNKEDFINQARGKSAGELIEFAFKIYGKKACIGTSLQKTGSVIVDLASKSGVEYSVFFIDTLHNPEETLQLFDEMEKKYSIKIQRLCPDPKDIEKLHKEMGQYPHFSIIGRERCCDIRKKRPLDKKLSELDVWISGLRADQSEYRETKNEKISIIRSREREIIKINPLFDWTQEQVDSYIKKNNVPYNKLYDYKSPYGETYREIGCHCCHIPVKCDSAKRAGKFPWEKSVKECGLHFDGSGI